MGYQYEQVPKTRKSKLNKTMLASYVSDLLHLPRGKHGECPVGRKIINAICQSMVEALRNGESVHVKGWGTLWVHPGKRHIFKPAVAQLVYSPVWVEYPGKKTVKFTTTYKVRNA